MRKSLSEMSEILLDAAGVILMISAWCLFSWTVGWLLCRLIAS